MSRNKVACSRWPEFSSPLPRLSLLGVAAPFGLASSAPVGHGTAATRCVDPLLYPDHTQPARLPTSDVGRAGPDKKGGE